MILILDAHISPSLAVWIKEKFSIDCFSATFLGLREANDETIFLEAKQQNAIVTTKDDDFVKLLEQLGSPPKIIWLTCGNSSKQRLKEIFEQHLLDALKLLKNTDLVEITGF
jgi:predicted nuclease of predicted toxin-antitoxin system